ICASREVGNHLFEAPLGINEPYSPSELFCKLFELFYAVFRCKAESDNLQSEAEIAPMPPFSLPPKLLPVTISAPSHPTAHLLNKRCDFGQRRAIESFLPP